MSIHPPPPRPLPLLHTHTHTHTVRLQPSQPAPRQKLEWGRGGTRCAVGERLEYFNFIWPTRDRCITRCVSLGPSPPTATLPLLVGVYICHLGISFHLTLLALIFSVGIRIVASHFAPFRLASPRLDVSATTHLRQVVTHLHK